uniref:Epsin 1b n=1 Tax=Scophthalmus maximus TaxID=52904 RepID=A0A8D3ANP4_SCOMX
MLTDPAAATSKEEGKKNRTLKAQSGFGKKRKNSRWFDSPRPPPDTMTSSMLRRQLKNLVQNYSEAEVKVREATSNDPWGPSSTQMADISDLTYNVVACNEIMTMLWKRLKDDKNWRHIHKSLTLLEYLLKTGDDRVLLKMKDSIYIVKALTEYRFVEKDGKDQGLNVREKAKVVLVLMEDDEKLKEERDFAVKTREKTSKGAAASSSDVVKDLSYKPCYVAGASGLPSLDNIPSVADLTAAFTARKEERLRQEAEKKDMERRAKMSEDELQWEDAGKGPDAKGDAWAGEKEEKEEVKPDPWGASKQPKEATDPWGTPAKAEKPANSDPWGAPSTPEEDQFAAPKTDEDPFESTKNHPFAVPKNGEDPFVASKDEPDPFSASKEDPFNTPKDSSDPFSAPKDKEDPFAAPKDKADPFNSSNNDPFNTPKDDPFNAPKDDPFNAPKEDPFNAPKDDPFNAPKDDPFNAPKDDPFNSPKDDPFNAPKDDPFTALATTPPKEDPFAAPTSSKDDPFTAPTTPPKEDPFSVPTKPAQGDPFASPTSQPKEYPFSASSNQTKDDPFTAPTTPPKEDPFSAPSKPTKDEPFAASTTPPKEDPFARSSPPKDDAADPFNAPTATSLQGGADAWGAPASSPTATAADPWETPSTAKETKGGDLWGNSASATTPNDNADPFEVASQQDNDPWGAPASAPASTDDAWGSPAPPSDSSTSGDPFGDGAAKANDPWGAPSNATSNTAGAFKAGGISSGPALRSGAVAGLSLPKTSALPACPFGSTRAPSHDAPPPSFGAVNPSSGAPLSQLPSYMMGLSYSGFSLLQVAPETGEGSPQVGLHTKRPGGGEGLVPTGYPAGNPLAGPPLWGTGMGQSSFFGGNHQTSVAHLGRSTPQGAGGIPVQPQMVCRSRNLLLSDV